MNQTFMMLILLFSCPGGQFDCCWLWKGQSGSSVHQLHVVRLAVFTFYQVDSIFNTIAPLQVGLSVYFIWDLLGPSVLVGRSFIASHETTSSYLSIGLAVLVICLPLNALVSTFFWFLEDPPSLIRQGLTKAGKVWYIMDRYQTRQMEQKDTRVNLVNEILNGIKVETMWRMFASSASSRCWKCTHGSSRSWKWLETSGRRQFLV